MLHVHAFITYSGEAKKGERGERYGRPIARVQGTVKLAANECCTLKKESAPNKCKLLSQMTGN